MPQSSEVGRVVRSKGVGMGRDLVIAMLINRLHLHTIPLLSLTVCLLLPVRIVIRSAIVSK